MSAAVDERRAQVYPLPIPFYPATQSELLWRFGWDPRRSNLGSIVAMLEGSSGGRPHIDLEAPGGLQAALEEVRNRHILRATRRAKLVDRALMACDDRSRETLRLVYAETPQPRCADVFGRLANLLPQSSIVHRTHEGMRSQLGMWLVRFCDRIDAVCGSCRAQSRSACQHKPVPTTQDVRARDLMKMECETRVADALAEYRRRRIA